MVDTIFLNSTTLSQMGWPYAYVCLVRRVKRQSRNSALTVLSAATLSSIAAFHAQAVR